LLKHIIATNQKVRFTCDACKKPIQGSACREACYYLCRCGHCNYNLCNKCFESGAAAANKGVAIEPDAFAPSCPFSHPMSKHVFDVEGETTAYYCDLCQTPIISKREGDFYYHCLDGKCNCEMCSSCYELFKEGKATFQPAKCRRDHIMQKVNICPKERVSEKCYNCHTFFYETTQTTGGFYVLCDCSHFCSKCIPHPVTPAPDPYEVKCPKGHAMTKRILIAGESAACTCDGCRKSIVGGPHGGVFYQCRQSGCNCDFCSTCRHP